MKKILIIALLVSGTTIKAQHDVSVDVLGFAFSKYGLGYEYAINPNNSVGINFNMTSTNFHIIYIIYTSLNHKWCKTGVIIKKIRS